jgi:hypothetical protein
MFARFPACSQGDRSVFKVVYVVLESQYQSSLTAACKRINAGQPDVAVEVRRWTVLEFRLCSGSGFASLARLPASCDGRVEL